jgi:hypothetical protein
MRSVRDIHSSFFSSMVMVSASFHNSIWEFTSAFIFPSVSTKATTWADRSRATCISELINDSTAVIDASVDVLSREILCRSQSFASASLSARPADTMSPFVFSVAISLFSFS